MRLLDAAYRIANPLLFWCINPALRFVCRSWLILALAAPGIAAGGTAADVQEPPPDKDIYSMPLEALLQMEVTTSASHPEKLSESPAAISVITQDLGMPRLNGNQVAQIVKRESPRTPVIMLTGRGTMINAEEFASADVDGVLSKPPRIQEIRELLDRVAGKSARR